MEYQVKPPSMMPASHMDAIYVSIALLPIQFPANAPDPHAWGPATHVGDLEEASGFSLAWLQLLQPLEEGASGWKIHPHLSL